MRPHPHLGVALFVCGAACGGDDSADATGAGAAGAGGSNATGGSVATGGGSSTTGAGSPTSAISTGAGGGQGGDGSTGLLPEEPLRGERLARIVLDVDAEGDPIPEDFLGVSMEVDSVRPALGVSAAEPNAEALTLLSNLGRATLRIGGTSTDQTCWNPSRGARPAGCSYDVTADTMGAIAGASEHLGWDVLVGVNLQLDDVARAVAFVEDGVSAIPAARVRALELGNEPNLYAARGVRPDGWGFPDYLEEWSAHADAIGADFPLAGPAVAPASSWEADIPEFAATTAASLITGHRYGVRACSAPRTVEELLDPSTATGERAWAEDLVAVAAAEGKPFHVTETGAVGCAPPGGFPTTFASALWAVDALFGYAAAGAAGANLHTWQNSSIRAGFGANNLFDAQGIPPAQPDQPWGYDTTARPMYYGALLFSRVQGSDLLEPAVSDATANLSVWAARERCDDAGGACRLRVVVVNKDLLHGGWVSLELSEERGPARLLQVRAPTILSASGITFGGREVDPDTGGLAEPDEALVTTDASGAYGFNVPHASVVMLTIEPEGDAAGEGGAGGGCETPQEPEPPVHDNPLSDTPCADPGAIRVETRRDPCAPPQVDYWMACTGRSPDGGTYNLFHGSDLASWEHVGALFPPGEGPTWIDGQVWAPEIHRVGDRFVAYFAAQPGTDPNYFCLGAATSEEAGGPYLDIGEPLLCDPEVSLIDATYFEDTVSGRHFLYFKPNWNAQDITTTIDVMELAPDGLSVTGPRVELIANDLPWEGDIVEAPWVFRQGSYLFLMYSADLYNDGYKVGVARGFDPMGPFEKRGDPILVGSADWLHPGHHSIVEAFGARFAVYHAYPASDPASGRRPLLDRMGWDAEDWPTIAGGTPSGGPVDLVP